MDIQKLLSLLSKEEGTKLDFKEKLVNETDSSKKELAKDICAIANSRGGRGYILFGIEDKTKKIKGIIKEDFLEEQIQQIVSTRIDPPIPISVETMEYEDKTVGAITIYNTEQKPHQLRDNGAFYIRRGSTTDIMRKEEIASMLQESGLISYELLPVIKAELKDLNHSLLVKFFGPEYIGNTAIPLLLGAGIINQDRDSGEYHPTLGGMLLFGDKPQNYIPYSAIRITNIMNSGHTEIRVFDGNIINMISYALKYLRDQIAEDFPFDIIIDCLSKAILNRDYFDISSNIEILIKNRTIEITTPGAVKKNFEGNKGKYIRRNMWLYLKLLSIDKERKFFDRPAPYGYFNKYYGKIKFFNIYSRNLYRLIINLNKLH